MAKYSLQPNEAMVLKDESVAHGSSGTYSGELMLTNQNLVLLTKGFFGGDKGLHVFPLNQIKVYNGQSQAISGKKSNGMPALEVYFLNGHETFSFQSGGKKKILAWVSKINLVVTGQEALPDQSSARALPGAELVAGVLKDTFGVFKSKLTSATDGPVRVAAKCRACGAPLIGRQGQAATCEYCSTTQQL